MLTHSTPLRAAQTATRRAARSDLCVRAMASGSASEAQAPVAVTKELKNAGPEPKRFTVANGQLITIASAAFAGLARFGSGGFAVGYKTEFVDAAAEAGKYSVMTTGSRAVKETSRVDTFKRPVKPIELYEFQGCPSAGRCGGSQVREAISILDLDVTVYPTPRNGKVWRPKAVELGGKAQFPYLVDNNTGEQMYESDAIISYLFNEYGDGQVPLGLRLGAATTITCGLALAPRVGKGSRAKPSRQPAEPLVMWGYELSPFVVVVKETLSELELPYKQVTCSRGSPKRQQLLEKRGHFQVPYLEDPNTGVYLFESAAINKYLEDTYALPA
ncbi:hypothetical protein COO60DRAFT_1493172 [Scenedesmus sp. NREL 46B-D3]|nr:hypothetical protein COO60DRAFT_1493172 [Scenedesmus sp. NREL 46B-D3]